MNTPPGTTVDSDSPIVQALKDLNKNLASIAQSAASGNAHLANMRIAARNRRRSESVSIAGPISQMLRWGAMEFEPLQKTVPGSGHALASRLLPGVDHSDPPKAEASIGSIPPDFHPVVLHYADKDEIFKLIEFYNESLGVEDDDARGDLVRKLWEFLTT